MCSQLWEVRCTWMKCWRYAFTLVFFRFSKSPLEKCSALSWDMESRVFFLCQYTELDEYPAMEMVTVYSVLGATVDWHFILVSSCPVRSSHPLFLHLRLATFYLTYWSAMVSGSGCCLGDFCLKKPSEILSALFVAFMMYFVRPISGLHVFRMRNHSEGTDYRNILGLPQHLTAGRMALWPVLLFMFSAGDLAGLLHWLNICILCTCFRKRTQVFQETGYKAVRDEKCLRTQM